MRTRVRKVGIEEEGVEGLRGRSESILSILLLFAFLCMKFGVWMMFPFFTWGKKELEGWTANLLENLVTKVVEAFESALAMMGD